MNANENIENIHKQIQKNIFRMMPEKFSKMCLYASVINNDNIKGEMFFYYFPAGILKKNPINVYEIPEIFSIDEEQYNKLEEELYESIKELRKYYKLNNKKYWTNLTITISGTNYIVEFNYDDLIKSKYNSFERHIIWRYKYLELPIESFSKEERKIIERYFDDIEYSTSQTYQYQENIYEKQRNTNMQYDNEFIKETNSRTKEKEEEIKNVKNQLLNF